MYQKNFFSIIFIESHEQIETNEGILRYSFMFYGDTIYLNILAEVLQKIFSYFSTLL
jgi:hypothetical protein